MALARFEMMVGIPPFYHNNQMMMFQLIRKAEIRFPAQISVSEEAKDLVRKLVMKNVEDRLGTKKGAEEIKTHPWFSSVDWEKVLNRGIQPPFKPKISGKTCVDNFDEEFTKESKQELSYLKTLVR